MLPACPGLEPGKARQQERKRCPRLCPPTVPMLTCAADPLLLAPEQGRKDPALQVVCDRGGAGEAQDRDRGVQAHLVSPAVHPCARPGRNIHGCGIPQSCPGTPLLVGQSSGRCERRCGECQAPLILRVPPASLCRRARDGKFTNFVEFKTYKIIYRRYAGLYFAMCVDVTDNELACLESIHLFVETLDRYFGNVCELDLVFNFHKTYMILDEFILGGELLETSMVDILTRMTNIEVTMDGKATTAA